jgi:diaminopimelate epimerase
MVEIPGGTLQIGVGPDYSLTMLGPAKKVAKGNISNELLEDAG